MSQSKSSKQKKRTDRRQRIRKIDVDQDLVSKQQPPENTGLTLYDLYEAQQLVNDLLRPRPDSYEVPVKEAVKA